MLNDDLIIKHSTLNIKHQELNIKHSTSNIQHQTSNINEQFLMSLTSKQKQLRKKLLSMYYFAGVGHVGSSLSCLDVLIALYEIKKESEQVLLSKGHAAGALYIVLNDKGEITDEELSLFCKNGTKLTAHPSAFFRKIFLLLQDR